MVDDIVVKALARPQELCPNMADETLKQALEPPLQISSCAIPHR